MSEKRPILDRVMFLEDEEVIESYSGCNIMTLLFILEFDSKDKKVQ